MDIGLKIGAVFSLADIDDEKEVEDDVESLDGDKKDIETGTETRFIESSDLCDSPQNFLPDDDTDEVDVMSDFNRIFDTNDNAKVPLTDNMSYTTDQDSEKTAEFLNDPTSVVDDPDAPPSLLLEGTSTSPSLLLEAASSSGLPTPPLITPGLEGMSPPVLQREGPLKKDAPIRERSQDKKKTCTKIDPCYVVLTYIDPVMNLKTAISSRTFKRSFVECSNMCKRVHFKRRLEAEKDVFDVKTPSKQKDYLFYLEQAEKEQKEKGKTKINKVPQINEIIEKHDLKVAARKKAYGTKALLRVRRTVSRLPHDFATRPKSPVTQQSDESNNDKKGLSFEVLALMNTNMRRKQHKVEIDSLKKLIAIKRSLNYKMKKAKRLRTEGFENFLRSDVTSNVSGRVRKANLRYGKEFAVCRRDIEEKRLVDVANTQLKRAESEIKRKVEDIKKNQERFDIKLSKKRRKYSSSENSVSDQPNAAKKAKLTDVVIDNPEEGNVKSFTRKHKTLKKAAAVYNGNVEISCEETETYKEKKKNAGMDGALIRDMPKEENTFSFLQNIHFDDKFKNSSSLEADGYIKMEPEFESHDQYMHVRQLLEGNVDKSISYAKRNASPAAQPNEIARYVPMPSVGAVTAYETSAEKEKYKMLKIPENVQKLFTNKEIKKEPIDENPVTTSLSVPITTSPIASCSSKVVIVGYANGVFKTVSLNPSPVDKAFASSARTETVETGIKPSPTSVNTGHGLQYIVPRQVLPKGKVISTCPETVKTVPVTHCTKCTSRSENFNTISGPSVSKIPLNPTASLGFTVSEMQSIRNTQLSLQLAQQQQEQPARVIGVKPSVMPVPVQTKVNSVTLGSPLNTSIPSPPAFVRQGYQAIPGKRITVAEGHGQNSVEKGKFYLLKMDGKNVLIPVDGNQTQPKAYVVNNDTLMRNTLTKTTNKITQDTTSTLASKIVSPTGIKPTILGVSGIGGVTQPKSTIGVLPNLKQWNTVHQNNFTVVRNIVGSPYTTNVLQNVTLSNVGFFPMNSYTTASASVKTSLQMTSGVRLGDNTLASKSFGLPKNIVQRNIQATVPLPVYQRPVQSTLASSNLQLKATACNTRSSDNLVKNQVYVPPVVLDKTLVECKSQSAGLLSDLLRWQQSQNSMQSFQESTKAKDDNDCINKTKKEVDVSAIALNNSEPFQEQAKSTGDDINIIERRKEEVNISANSQSGKLCEKSGIFLSNEATKEKPKELEENSQAFKETVTAREERLRHLKELIKEKQKAVEEIRSNKVK